MTEGLAELKAMEVAFHALEPLEEAARRRAVGWLLGALGVGSVGSMQPEATPASPGASNGRGENQTIPSAPESMKEFMASKKPTSSAERLACLAYYLTHFVNVGNFKSTDLMALNTEAAGPRISNPSRDVDNADRGSGYLVGASGKTKQITVRGEKMVEALPDRDAVKAALAEYPHKRKRPSSKKAPSKSNGPE